jgi:alkylated DNA repair protein alkB family protein 6
MPHEDGDAYADVVATVSLGGCTCLEILEKGKLDVEAEEEEGKRVLRLPTRIFQEPRSLLITTGTAYRDLMHGIASVEVDEDLNAGTVANWELLGDKGGIEEVDGRSVRETRISLTYRDVLKVSSAASKVFGKR